MRQCSREDLHINAFPKIVQDCVYHSSSNPHTSHVLYPTNQSRSRTRNGKLELSLTMSKMNLDIAKPITLPCGLTLPNRLVKAAMAESWCDQDKMPHTDLIKAYGLWAEGEWGMIITGNIHVDATYTCTPEDIAVNDKLSRKAHVNSFSKWAAAASKNGTPTILQLNHPGRQSSIGAGTRSYCAKSIAPSPIGVSLGPGLIATAASAFAFGTPREMSDLEIEDVVRRFGTAAQLAYQSGFAGVQINAAHGYLLTTFLSAKTNQRGDKYGGSPKNRAEVVVEIIRAIRAAVPVGFCLGIKINSVDHQKPGEFDDCLEQLSAIVEAGVDFVEISGGNYEDPKVRASCFYKKRALTRCEDVDVNNENDYGKSVVQHGRSRGVLPRLCQNDSY